MDEKPTPPPGRKFAPRAGIQRKTKAEREQYAQAEAARERQRLAATKKNEASAPTAANTNTAAGRSRGRGRGQAAIVASDGGVFGGVAPGTGRGRGTGGMGVSEILRDLEGFESEAKGLGLELEVGGDGEKKSSATRKKGGAASSGGAGKSSDQALYVASDDDGEEAATRDIERIWISSDDEDKEDRIVERKGKQRATAAKLALRGTTGLRPVRAPRLMRDGDGAAAKPEADEMDIDEQFTTDGPSSPELSMRKGAKKKATKTKDAKGPVETGEEKAERLRLAEDVRKLRMELVGADWAKRATTTDEMDDDDDDDQNARHEKLFLFQFPPLTPYLVDTNSRFEVNDALEDPQGPSADTGNRIKKDPTADTRKDATSEVKREEDGDDSKPTKVQVPGALTARSMRLPAGRVGKLNVHKSGKVSLDWGGADMEVRYGNEVDFLQDAVLVGGDEGRDSWALGQVKTKLVVIPDWQKLYD